MEGLPLRWPTLIVRQIEVCAGGESSGEHRENPFSPSHPRVVWAARAFKGGGNNVSDTQSPLPFRTPHLADRIVVVWGGRKERERERERERESPVKLSFFVIAISSD